MYDLFSGLDRSDVYTGEWRPEAPPVLDGIRDIELDCESDGLRWWAGSKPIGFSVRYGDRSQYLPFGHRGGGNLDEAVVKRWAQRELRGKRITNINTRFDVHMLHAWGIDLEAQGNEVSDVAHYAALLDDHRLRFNLNDIATDYLGRSKVGRDLDARRMADYHAGEVAPRAISDVELVGALKEKMWPMLTAQDLHRVRALEDRVIYVVCEMERNGTPIDVDLLDQWVTESEQRYHRLLWEIYGESGVKFTGTNETWKALFEKLGIPITEFTDKGNASFTDAVLKLIEHPIVQKARLAVRLASLRSKYLVNYAKKVDRKTGILRYALHQLRAQKNEWDSSEGAGTVTGRFSSTALTIPGEEEEGVNIQQIMKVAKQRVLFGFDEEDDTHDLEIYLIRQLHRPAHGYHLSADAKQIEYRIFAHYANNPTVIQAYRDNPNLHFHKFILELLRPYVKLTYRRQKDLNFAKVYGAGVAKMALMMGFITETQHQKLKREYPKGVPRTHPLLKETAEIDAIYNREIPEVKPLLKLASDTARTRGFVKTILGRRSRFPDKHRLHKAFNSIDQGGAADINKMKLVELHEAREETQLTLRYTVHDEVDGDIPDQEHADKVQAILDRQSIELRVPILWDVSIGANWKECA